MLGEHSEGLQRVGSLVPLQVPGERRCQRKLWSYAPGNTDAPTFQGLAKQLPDELGRFFYGNAHLFGGIPQR
jgi:hypothetical protein